jgi:hypothetical protein
MPNQLEIMLKDIFLYYKEIESCAVDKQSLIANRGIKNDISSYHF